MRALACPYFRAPPRYFKATRTVAEDEELCISYIESDLLSVRIAQRYSTAC